MPCRPSKTDSIGSITPFSTSTGAAPGYGTLILIILRSERGNISLLIVAKEIAPAKKTKTITKFAATGLRLNHEISPLEFTFISLHSESLVSFSIVI